MQWTLIPRNLFPSFFRIFLSSSISFPFPPILCRYSAASPPVDAKQSPPQTALLLWPSPSRVGQGGAATADC